MKYEQSRNQVSFLTWILSLQIRWVSWQRSPCSALLKVIGSQRTIDDIQVVDNFGLDMPLLSKVHKMWSVDYQQNSWNCCHQMSVQFYGLQCSYLVLLIYNTVAEMHIFLSEVDHVYTQVSQSIDNHLVD